jgi:hypothetical protein
VETVSDLTINRDEKKEDVRKRCSMYNKSSIKKEVAKRYQAQPGCWRTMGKYLEKEIRNW